MPFARFSSSSTSRILSNRITSEWPLPVLVDLAFLLYMECKCIEKRREISADVMQIPSGSDAGKSIPGSDAPKNPAEVMPGGSSGEVRLLRRKFSQVHRPRQLRPRERSQMPSFRQSSWSESRYYCFTALPGERRTIQRSRSVSCSSDPVRPTSNLVFCDPFLNPRLSGGGPLAVGSVLFEQRFE